MKNRPNSYENLSTDRSCGFGGMSIVWLSMANLAKRVGSKLTVVALATGGCLWKGLRTPSEPEEKEPAKNNLVGYDNRCKRTAGKTQVGYNGYANLTFQGPCLCIEYRDIDDETVLLEEWKVDVYRARKHEETALPEALRNRTHRRGGHHRAPGVVHQGRVRESPRIP